MDVLQALFLNLYFIQKNTSITIKNDNRDTQIPWLTMEGLIWL